MELRHGIIVDNQLIQSILEWVATHPTWAGAFVFLVAFTESLALVGILVPGIFILFGVGALIGMDALDLLPIWIWASLGAFLGDALSYGLGYHYRESLLAMWPFRNFPARIEQGREFIRRHGRKSIFLGRFIGPLRPVVPVTAGMLAMRPGKFFNTDIAASVAWGPVYLLPGVLFGASLEVAAEYAGRLSLLVALLVATLWLLIWSGRVVYELIAARSARWLRHAIRWSRRHPVIGRFTGPLLDPSRPEVLSVAMLGLGLFIMFWGLITSLLLLPYGEQPLPVDQQTFDFALSLRNHLTDPIMVFLVQLGNWRVLLVGAMVVEGLLLFQRRYKAAAHWLVAVIGGVLLQNLLTSVLSVMPRFSATPGANLPSPSAAIVLATTCYGFFAVLVAPDLQRVHKRWPYVAAAVSIALLALARLYLGVEVLSTIISGFLLGGCWTMVVGIAYRQRIGRPYGAALETSLFYLALISAMLWAFTSAGEFGYPDYAVRVERHDIDSGSWWNGEWRSIPAMRSEYGALESQHLNMQLSGDINELKEVLLDNGWLGAGKAGWSWPLQSLNPRADLSSLPIPARNYLGRPELLHMRNTAGSGQWVETFHLWESGWHLTDKAQPLYVGQLMNETLSRRLGLVSYWHGTAAEEQQLIRLANLLKTSGYTVERRESWLLIRQ